MLTFKPKEIVFIKATVVKQWDDGAVLVEAHSTSEYRHFINVLVEDISIDAETMRDARGPL